MAHRRFSSCVAPPTLSPLRRPRSIRAGSVPLDEDLSDTEVDEGGGEAPSLPANVDELSNFGRVPSEVIAMSDAEGPTVGRRLVVS